MNNFEKALEKAKLLHNNQAQQAIISVSLAPSWTPPVGSGAGVPSAPQPSPWSIPQILITYQLQDNCGYVWTVCYCQQFE